MYCSRRQSDPGYIRDRHARARLRGRHPTLHFRPAVPGKRGELFHGSRENVKVVHNLERVIQDAGTFAKTRGQCSEHFPGQVIESFWRHLGLQAVEVSKGRHELHVNRNYLL